MPSAYITRLNREMLAEASRPEPVSLTLHDRILSWYTGLPEISRHRAFAMSELESAIGTQGKYLSPILLSLGWQRRRKWTGAGHYPRYWVPPQG